MDLTDEQWEILEHLIPKLPRRADGRGRPWSDPRAVLNGILWILRTEAPWNDMPERYPPDSTCHRWFQNRVRSGVMEQILRALRTSAIGGSGPDGVLHRRHSEKRGIVVGKTKQGKGTKIIRWQW